MVEAELSFELSTNDLPAKAVLSESASERVLRLYSKCQLPQKLKPVHSVSRQSCEVSSQVLQVDTFEKGIDEHRGSAMLHKR